MMIWPAAGQETDMTKAETTEHVLILNSEDLRIDVDALMH